MSSITPASKAYIAPFGVFVLMIGLQSAVSSLFGKPGAPLLLREPQYWIYPAQTLICGALVAVFWRHYEFAWPKRVFFTLGIATLIFVIWISPQAFFHAAPRREGFDPTVFESNPALYVTVLALRFMRAVIVVALVEEIFWRGFLLRWLIDEDFTKIPFGTFSRMSFAVVTIGFMFEHQQADWPAALISGVLFNLIAWHTKSLSSCVLAHAATNLLLSIYVLQTRQWGFW